MLSEGPVKSSTANAAGCPICLYLPSLFQPWPGQKQKSGTVLSSPQLPDQGTSGNSKAYIPVPNTSTQTPEAQQPQELSQAVSNPLSWDVLGLGRSSLIHLLGSRGI